MAANPATSCARDGCFMVPEFLPRTELSGGKRTRERATFETRHGPVPAASRGWEERQSLPGSSFSSGLTGPTGLRRDDSDARAPKSGGRKPGDFLREPRGLVDELEL